VGQNLSQTFGVKFGYYKPHVSTWYETKDGKNIEDDKLGTLQLVR